MEATRDLKSLGRETVPVRVRSPAPSMAESPRGRGRWPLKPLDFCHTLVRIQPPLPYLQEIFTLRGTPLDEHGLAYVLTRAVRADDIYVQLPRKWSEKI